MTELESPTTNQPSGPDAFASGSGKPQSAREPHGLKAKAAEEVRSFLALFFYLWVVFGVFMLNQDIVQREDGINFAMQGFALVNALVFAKVVLVFNMFDPGAWLRKRPLIYPIVYETFLVTILLLVVHVAERVINGLIRGRTMLESLPSIGGGGLAGLLSASVIMFVALLPLFGLRNLDLAMGRGRLRAMLLGGKSGS